MVALAKKENEAKICTPYHPLVSEPGGGQRCWQSEKARIGRNGSITYARSIAGL